jgi:hypothetical protein
MIPLLHDNAPRVSRPLSGLAWRLIAALRWTAAVACGIHLPDVRGQALFPPAEPDPLEILARLKRGEQVARVLCQSCHLYPEPDLLDRASWANGPLRKMAPFLGVARFNLENRPDGQILRDAHIFPESPILPIEDWKAVWDYYLASAPDQPLPQGPRDPIAPTTGRFKAELGIDPAVAPAITLVHIEPETRTVLVGDARNRALHRLDVRGQRVGGVRVDSAPASYVKDGDAAYVTLIGSVYPSDEKTGRLVRIRETSGGVMSVEEVLSGLKRPVDAVPVDLDGDGRRDLAVAQFGNFLGRQVWFANEGGGRYREELLWEAPGGTRVVVTDANRDGRPDLLYLMAQGREGVYLFENQGGGEFTPIPLIQFPSIYGCTSLELVDFNGDGHPDLLTVNGDNGEYPSTFKRYHGLRIHLNDGHFRFKEAWFFPINGAFKAVARDFDGDGDPDLAAISFFADYDRSPEESFVYLENQGGLKFVPSSVPEALAGRWLTMDAGDLDGDGLPEIVLGSFLEGPRATPVPPALVSRWSTGGVSTLILRNQNPNPSRNQKSNSSSPAPSKP